MYSFHKNRQCYINWSKYILSTNLFVRALKEESCILVWKQRNQQTMRKTDTQAYIPVRILYIMYIHSYHILVHCVLDLLIKCSLLESNLVSNRVTYFSCVYFLYCFVDDHSRVVLKNSQDGNDYINANYIEVSIINLI